MPPFSATLYLASRSSRRQQLLTSMGLAFKIVPSRYRERWYRKTGPEILCVRHAAGKARRAALPKNARYVLGGDTIVWYRGFGLGKPQTRAEALRVLQKIQGKKHTVYTGLALWDREKDLQLTGCAKTEVWLKKVGRAWLQNYVDRIHPFDKAGSYAIQARPKIVRKIRGSYSNVVGLPKELLRKMLNEMRRMTDAS